MDEREFLVRVAARFSKLKIPYMVTGSVAVSYFGTPRATHDIDMVVSVGHDNAAAVRETFSEDFYVSDIEHAVRHRQMFNLVDRKTQFKVDCWILDDSDEYRMEAFRRRQRIGWLDVSISITSPEDLVISKLIWFKEAQTDIHLNDIRGILRVQENKVDISYIDDWTSKLSLSDLWLKLKNEMSS